MNQGLELQLTVIHRVATLLPSTFMCPMHASGQLLPRASPYVSSSRN
jgi:hypothetical protein